jgi:hypothetical protein
MAEGVKDPHAREVLKGFGAELDAIVADSESQGGRQNASPNTSGKTILNQEPKKPQGREKEQQELLQFPNVARELKARAHGLRSQIEGLPPWVEDPDAHEQMAVSFTMLENELISNNRISVPAGNEHTFEQLSATRAVREAELIIERLIAEYRELVPDGGAATEEELLELGVDGMIAAVEKQRSGTGGKNSENDARRTTQEMDLIVERLRARYRAEVPGWGVAKKRKRSSRGRAQVHRDRPEQSTPRRPATK